MTPELMRWGFAAGAVLGVCLIDRRWPLNLLGYVLLICGCALSLYAPLLWWTLFY